MVYLFKDFMSMYFSSIERSNPVCFYMIISLNLYGCAKQQYYPGTHAESPVLNQSNNGFSFGGGAESSPTFAFKSSGNLSEDHSDYVQSQNTNAFLLFGEVGYNIKDILQVESTLYGMMVLPAAIDISLKLRLFEHENDYPIAAFAKSSYSGAGNNPIAARGQTNADDLFYSVDSSSSIYGFSVGKKLNNRQLFFLGAGISHHRSNFDVASYNFEEKVGNDKFQYSGKSIFYSVGFNYLTDSQNISADCLLSLVDDEWSDFDDKKQFNAKFAVNFLP